MLTSSEVVSSIPWLLLSWAVAMICCQYQRDLWGVESPARVEYQILQLARLNTTHELLQNQKQNTLPFLLSQLSSSLWRHTLSFKDKKVNHKEG